MALSDDWMAQTQGGKRTSAYSEPKVCKVCDKPIIPGKPHKHSRMERFKRVAAEMKRQRIDSITE